MGLAEDLRIETTRFIEEHYPGEGGVAKLGRELAPLTGQSARSVAQMFRYHLGQDTERDHNPNKFYLYFVKDLRHPVSGWARNCLEVYSRYGEGLPTQGG